MEKRILGKKTTRCLNEKIAISIQCYGNSFDITIKISKNIPIGSQLKDKNEKVQVNLWAQKNITEDISISRTVSYKRNSDKSLKTSKMKISYDKNSIIKGFLVISPEFYLPLSMLKHAQIEQ